MTAQKCNECGSCQEACRFAAIDDFQVDPALCEGCGVCKLVCPAEAVEMRESLAGYACISETRFGPLVHAELFPGEEASGKLVAMVREMARDLAASRNLDLVLIDGSPGIGCPVIASLTGVDLALVVTEPTITGEHDMERILDVAVHFGINTAVCINKYDLNPAGSRRIEALCRERCGYGRGKAALPCISSRGHGIGSSGNGDRRAGGTGHIRDVGRSGKTALNCLAAVMGSYASALCMCSSYERLFFIPVERK